MAITIKDSEGNVITELALGEITKGQNSAITTLKFVNDYEEINTVQYGPPGYSPRSLDVDDDYIYIALYASDNNDRVIVIDKTDFSNTVSIATGDNPFAFVRDAYFYVIGGSALTVYRKSDLQQETYISLSRTTLSLYVDDDYIYVGYQRIPYNSAGGIKVYSKDNYSLVTTRNPGSSAVRSSIYQVCSDDNYVYGGCDDGLIHIFRKSDWGKETTVAGGRWSVSTDSNYLYAGNNGSVSVYDKTDWSLVTTLSDPTNYVRKMHTDNNYLYAGCNDGYLYVYRKADWSLYVAYYQVGVSSLFFVGDDYLYATTETSAATTGYLSYHQLLINDITISASSEDAGINLTFSELEDPFSGDESLNLSDIEYEDEQTFYARIEVLESAEEGSGTVLLNANTI